MTRRVTHVRFAFDNDREAPRRARRAVAELFTDSHDPVASLVELAVSELVANAVIHSDSGGVLNAWDDPASGPLRIEVEDFAPIPITDGEESLGGRGLMVVDRITKAWGVETTPTGKIIWAEFERPA